MKLDVIFGRIGTPSFADDEDEGPAEKADLAWPDPIPRWRRLVERVRATRAKVLFSPREEGKNEQENSPVCDVSGQPT